MRFIEKLGNLPRGNVIRDGGWDVLELGRNLGKGLARDEDLIDL